MLTTHPPWFLQIAAAALSDIGLLASLKASLALTMQKAVTAAAR
jgi:hypothetical protein